MIQGGSAFPIPVCCCLQEKTSMSTLHMLLTQYRRRTPTLQPHLVEQLDHDEGVEDKGVIGVVVYSEQLLTPEQQAEQHHQLWGCEGGGGGDSWEVG